MCVRACVCDKVVAWGPKGQSFLDLLEDSLASTNRWVTRGRWGGGADVKILNIKFDADVKNGCASPNVDLFCSGAGAHAVRLPRHQVQAAPSVRWASRLRAARRRRVQRPRPQRDAVAMATRALPSGARALQRGRVWPLLRLRVFRCVGVWCACMRALGKPHTHIHVSPMARLVLQDSGPVMWSPCLSQGT